MPRSPVETEKSHSFQSHRLYIFIDAIFLAGGMDILLKNLSTGANKSILLFLNEQKFFFLTKYISMKSILADFDKSNEK